MPIPKLDLRLTLYTLGGPDGHTPIATHDVLKWAKWKAKARRRADDPSRVGLTELPGGAIVSTVFIGTDMGFASLFDPTAPPVLFETMTSTDHGFGNPSDRYCTWAEAEAGHERIVADALKTMLDIDAALSASLARKARAGPTPNPE